MSTAETSHGHAVETIETPGRGNGSRGGDGRFRRSVETAGRDQRAAMLASQGWTYSEIAAELGFANRGVAHKAASRAMFETAMGDGTTEELRRQQVEELRLLRRKAWDLINNPPPAISRTGKIVTTVGSDGEEVPVPDAAAVVSAMAVVLRANERVSRLRGTEAPKRTMSVSATLEAVSPADWDALIDSKRRELAIELANRGDDLMPEDVADLDPRVRRHLEEILASRRVLIPGSVEA